MIILLHKRLPQKDMSCIIIHLRKLAVHIIMRLIYLFPLLWPTC